MTSLHDRAFRGPRDAFADGQPHRSSTELNWHHCWGKAVEKPQLSGASVRAEVGEAGVAPAVVDQLRRTFGFARETGRQIGSTALTVSTLSVGLGSTARVPVVLRIAARISPQSGRSGGSGLGSASAFATRAFRAIITQRALAHQKCRRASACGHLHERGHGCRSAIEEALN